MKVYKYTKVFVLMLGICFQGFAAQGGNIYNQCADTENYYVQPSGVYISPNGIYVSIDGALIQVNTLCADERGVFVPYEEIVGRLVKCPFCRRWYDPDSKIPHNCKGVSD
ncbi:MAG: hypothetical protein S4CHLAM123_02860 [Chlamydiales bacterium]|nr:hypothetical protein [Chlamydiales bacterium]